MGLPYNERRGESEALERTGPYWHTPGTFDDTATLFEAVSERELEGIVAKRRGGATGQVSETG